MQQTLLLLQDTSTKWEMMKYYVDMYLNSSEDRS